MFNLCGENVQRTLTKSRHIFGKIKKQRKQRYKKRKKTDDNQERENIEKEKKMDRKPTRRFLKLIQASHGGF